MTTETQPQAEVKTTSMLAQEVFGGDYFGEVTEPEVQEEVSEVPEEAAPQAESEDVTDEVEIEAGAEQDTDSEEEATTISSFSELIESQDWDKDWADSLELDVKINGEPGKAKLLDLVNSYQTQTAAEQRLTEAKEKAKEITNELAAEREKLTEQSAVVASLLSEEKEAINAEFQALESGNLANVDPADYAAKRLKLQDKQVKLQQKIEKAANAYHASIATNQAEAEENLKAYKEQEHASLLEAIPDWKNPDTMKAEGGELFTYLTESGIPAEEAGNILDHKVIVLARKAMLYDKVQSKAEPAKKKLKLIPKTLKPGAASSTVNVNQNEIAKLEAKKGTGTFTTEDAVKLNRLKTQR